MHLIILTIYRHILSVNAGHLGKCVSLLVGVLILCTSLHPYLCVFWLITRFFLHFFNILSRFGQTDTCWHHCRSVDVQLSHRQPGIKKLTVCSSIQGLFIMYLLPLFKSLMQKVYSHVTQSQREREREGIFSMRVVWRNWDPCTIAFKQRFPWQLHAPFVPLSKLRDEVPQLPLILMHIHTHTLTF